MASPDTIRVLANWRALDQGVLGSAGPTNVYANFKNAPLRNVWYSVALAEKIAGESLNGTNADINCNFSSSINWYFGTDGNPPSGEFDLVSVILHELGHGLGFLAYKNVSSDGIGTLGFNNIFDVYSYHLADASGGLLRDTTKGRE